MRRERKRMRFFRKYRRVLSRLLTAAAVLLALAGSWQYYASPDYAGTVIHERLISNVLFSTLKLFAFSPTVSLGVTTPILYEAAKWLCPLCTGYWIFSAVETLLRNRFERLSRKLRKRKQTAVFGCNPESLQFIRSLREESAGGAASGGACALFSEETLSQEERLRLERSHIIVEDTGVFGDFDGKDGSRPLRRFFEDFSEAAFFSEDSFRNFVLFRSMAEYLGQHPEAAEKEDFLCLVRCEDRLMERMVMEYYDSIRKGTPLDMHLFNLPSLAARELFSREPVYGNILEGLESGTGGCRQGEALFSNIPQPHVLIAGFGSYGQAVLRETLLTGDLTPCSKAAGYERLRVTIIDRNQEKVLSFLRDCCPAIERICVLQVIEADIRSLRVEEALDQYPLFTYGAVCFSEPLLNIEAVKKLERYLTIRLSEKPVRETEPGLFDAAAATIPLALRMDEDPERFMVLLEREGNLPVKILPFGNRAGMLKRKYLAAPEMEKEAADFHAAYCRLQKLMFENPGETADKSGDGPGAGDGTADERILWRQLDYEKRCSNRAQALCRPYLRRLAALLSEFPPKEEILSCGSDTGALFSKLAEFPVLDRLAEWEHRRWSNFHYVSGYVGYDPDPENKGKNKRIETETGEKLYGRVHNCLIEDWEALKRDPYGASTIIYDVCAVYAGLSVI